ncbi:hypothetical protein [Chitinophaga barathri]|uniref:Cytochrome c domain-containing protein n=1 Tax=Chitinophaga barathri TaxID=1647451 RepID=A0A3N4MT02_9BACT|nr:hypothetical protein [Chitinophaga barathri]RPD43270.1 hypothetical protein EG028_02945 [Chitinophaga barathri]
MKKKSTLAAALCIPVVIFFAAYSCVNTSKPKDGETSETLQLDGAFQNHRDSVPSKSQYDAPLFVLSHDYPTTVAPVVNPPWQQALNGQPLSSANALIFMDSLKSYIAPNVLPFFTDNAAWTAAQYGWFHEPWLGTQREAILGTYLGNGNPANMFKSLKVDEAGYVLVLYDSTAAYTVGQIWGKTGEKVNLINNASQFTEGSIVVKLAFSNINYPEWPVMKDAQIMSVYDTIPTGEDPRGGYQVRKVSFFQMDVIVKDSIASPQTGWVYSTFVYNKDVQGSLWDKMVPLGAMWGNDPGVNSPLSPPYPPLYETVINPAAPQYSTETLGWGGRLSGPNDGAVAQLAYDINTGQPYKNLALSSCMSCHSPAQDAFVSFLLPGPVPTSDSLLVFTPGGPQWNLWFRNNYGNIPFDTGQVAMDYDMVMAFKSIPAYEQAKSPGQSTRLTNNIEAIRKFRRHNTRSRFWH